MPLPLPERPDAPMWIHVAVVMAVQAQACCVVTVIDREPPDALNDDVSPLRAYVQVVGALMTKGTSSTSVSFPPAGITERSIFQLPPMLAGGAPKIFRPV